jgi:hypothetical protein
MELGPLTLPSCVPSLWLDSLAEEEDFIEAEEEWSKLSVVDCTRRSCWVGGAVLICNY